MAHGCPGFGFDRFERDNQARTAGKDFRTVRLDEYQDLAAATDQRPNPNDVSFPLLGLAGEVGSLVAEYKKHVRGDALPEQFVNEAREDLGDLLWYVAALARTLNVPLSAIAQSNLRKTSAAWGAKLPPPPNYDGHFPEDQRLPRSFVISFHSHKSEGLHRVSMYLGTSAVGDSLDDNSYVEDFYRFHDAFHLASAAVLGWSPIMRQLLRRKRKLSPEIDRIEDGARARAIEEGLSAYVFSVASKYDYFKGVSRVDWDLLKAARKMTEHLEVCDQPHIAWQSTFLQAYDVWRALIHHDGGAVECDLDKRRLRFVSL